jgi:hypothetical protein
LEAHSKVTVALPFSILLLCPVKTWCGHLCGPYSPLWDQCLKWQWSYWACLCITCSDKSQRERWPLFPSLSPNSPACQWLLGKCRKIATWHHHVEVFLSVSRYMANVTVGMVKKTTSVTL